MNAPKCWRIFECRSMLEHDLFYLFRFLFHSRCRAMVSVVVIPSMAGHDKPTMQSNNGFFSFCLYDAIGACNERCRVSSWLHTAVEHTIDYTLNLWLSCWCWYNELFIITLSSIETWYDCRLYPTHANGAEKIAFCLFVYLSLFSLRSSAGLSKWIHTIQMSCKFGMSWLKLMWTWTS